MIKWLCFKGMLVAISIKLSFECLPSIPPFTMAEDVTKQGQVQ